MNEIKRLKDALAIETGARKTVELDLILSQGRTAKALAEIERLQRSRCRNMLKRLLGRLLGFLPWGRKK